MFPVKLNPVFTRIIQHQDLSLCTDSEGKLYMDLDTGMKSHAHAYFYDDHIIIRKRYGEHTVIDIDNVDAEDIFKNIVRCVESCRCNRDYMSNGWARILEEFHG